ncbi:MAG: glycosyltransferase family 9 protein [Pseudobdellovibrionaceae bacterium]
MSSILVIKLGALGDFVYALGAMKAIRVHHTGDQITLLTTKPFVRLAEASGYFDKIVVDTRPKFWNVRGWWNLARTFDRLKISRVYDLQNNDRTFMYFRIFSRLLKPFPEWVGAVEGASHANLSPERTQGHAFTGHQQTLALAGIHNIKLDDLSWLKSSLDGYNVKKPYVLIVAGCSPTHPEKRWPVAHFRTVCAKLIRLGYHPVLLGTQDEAEVNQAIARGLDVIDLTGQTALFDIPELARGASGAIGNDTGPMHLAALAGCPVVMLFTTQRSKISKHAPPKDKVEAFETYDLKDIAPDSVMDAFLRLSAPAKSAAQVIF